MSNKLTTYIRDNKLGLFKSFVVVAIFAMLLGIGVQALSVYQEKGKELGKIELASVEEIPTYLGKGQMENVWAVTKWFQPDRPADKRSYQWPAKNLNEFVEYKSRNLAYQAAFTKAVLEADTSGYENFMGYDIARQREALDGYLTQYTAQAEQALGKEQVAAAWQQKVNSDSEVISGKQYYTAKVKADWSSVWLLVGYAFAIAVFLTGVYNILKLKAEEMKVWCEFGNLRIFGVSGLFFITLIIDAYPLHGAADQLKTVRRTCAGLLWLVLSLGAAAANAQTSSGTSGSSTKQKTDYALIVESRESIALTGDDPKVENAVRVLFTTPDGIFLEDVSVKRTGRFTNTFITGKWFDTPLAAKFGKLRFGPYGGWRFTDAPGVSREDSVVGGAKVSFVKTLTKDKNVALNVFAPTFQVERSVQKRTFTLANTTQVFGSWKKKGINLGAEFMFRKTQGRGFTGYVGPIFAKKLVSGKNFVKSLFGEAGLFKEIPTGDLRFRLRFTLQL